MNELQIFQNPEFGEVRTLEIDGEGWFVGADVARALGYSKPQHAVARNVDEDDCRTSAVMDNLGRMQQTRLINESGLYSLVILSELPSAKKFKRWVTSEVLPSIRKTGGYSVPQLTPNELILQLAQSNVDLERRVDGLESKFDNAMKAFTAPSVDHWKSDMNAKIDDIVRSQRLSNGPFRGRLYAELEQMANVKLNSRLLRMRTRLREKGYTYKECQALGKLDVISKDKQLRVIFEGIVKKRQAMREAGGHA